MKKLLKYLSPFWLGFALSSFAHVNLFMWQFYVIIVPFFILNGLREDSINNSN